MPNLNIVNKIQRRRGLGKHNRGLDTQHTTYRRGGVFTHKLHNIQGRRGLDTQHIGEEGS